MGWMKVSGLFFHLDGGDTALYAACIAAQVLAIAQEAFCMEGLSRKDSGHIEPVAYLQFAPADFLHPTQAFGLDCQKKLAMWLITDGNSCAHRQVGGIDGGCVLVDY